MTANAENLNGLRENTNEIDLELNQLIYFEAFIKYTSSQKIFDSNGVEKWTKSATVIYLLFGVLYYSQSISTTERSSPTVH